MSAFEVGDRVHFNSSLSPADLAALLSDDLEEVGVVVSVEVNQLETRLAVEWSPGDVIGGYYEGELELADLPADLRVETVEAWLAS